MTIYLNPTSKSALKYSSKVVGKIIEENEFQLIVLTSNSLEFIIPKPDIISAILIKPYINQSELHLKKPVIR